MRVDPSVRAVENLVTIGALSLPEKEGFAESDFY